MSKKGYISKNELANNVSAQNQLNGNPNITYERNEGGLKVLFVGNSITRHGYKADIGWYGDWGMAASSKDKDYVHRTIAMLEEKYGKIDACITQGAAWERDYFEAEKTLSERYGEARDFGAELVIIRIGENMPKGSAPACKPQFDKMIKFFASRENAKVIVTDSFWRNDDRDGMIREIAEENGYTFCHICDLEEDESNMAIGLFEHKGVARHPSDLGMERIAKKIVESYDKMTKNC